MIRSLIAAAILAILFSPPPTFAAEQRYTFDSPPGYQTPQTAMPAPRSTTMEYVDLGVLAAALLLGTWLVHWRRSRRGVLLLMLASLAYFGFYRQGCVCPIGSIQNVAQSLADNSYPIPMTVVGFFVLPLAFSLLFGRVFCSSVCPLGAVQDAVLLHPISLPYWLTRMLGIFPWVYLGLAVMLAATGTAYVICMYDPFVAFFRLSGGAQIFVVGVCFVVISMFIGRAYCRFFCPYGALLGVCSHVAWKQVSISPGKCVNCGRCLTACPFGAIRPAINDVAGPSPTRRVVVIGVLALALAAAGAWACSGLGKRLAALDPMVATADRVTMEDVGKVKGYSFESNAYRTSDKNVDELHTAAVQRRSRFDLNLSVGGMKFTFGLDSLIGAILGIVLAFKIGGALRWRSGATVTPAAGDCVACGRCYSACPVKRKE